MNVLANRLDVHLKTALLAYFDNEVLRKVLNRNGRRQWQTGTTNNAFLISLSLFCLRHIFGIRKSNENYRCETDVIYFRQHEMRQKRVMSGSYTL